MKKPAKWILRVIIGLLAVCGAATLIVGIGFNGFEDYTHGRIDRIVGQVYDDVDRVEIFLLAQSPGATESGSFPVRPYDEDYPVYGTATLTGSDAKKAAELWSYTFKAAKIQAMCHDPPYGVRMYAGKKLRFESSICWHCYNFYIQEYPGSYVWYGFDAGSEGATDLLALFDSKLPYPKPTRTRKGESGPRD